LEPVLERAFDGVSHAKKPGTVTTSVLVIKLRPNGEQLIAERYRPGFGIFSGYRTWSTTKSITAALMGIASRQGLVTLDAPVAVPEWPEGDARRAITYQQLMWMSSGLASGGPNSAAVYFGGQDVISAATGTSLEAAPGTRWKYANNDTLLLMRSLRHLLHDDLRYLRFPYDELLHPLGMYNTRMEVDHQGNFVASSQTYTTARDLARFGILLARDGVHKGKRLLPEGFVKFVSTPAPTKPPVPNEWGYGAQFWLLDTMPGVPKGTFTTFGNKGQYVSVVPSEGLVIVRTGVDPNGIEYKQDRLVAEVLQVLGRAPKQ
jgi:CubicO group peptidase (beta-lactamase class C family)